ncbi:MAG: hypothetical protein IPK83_12695 [Planctomycetes bacterium]|nr:hypothetical protein [Planctomycetota bacterium]
MQAQEYATSFGSGTFRAGCCLYDDRNANGQYDFGEGEFGSTVLLNGEEKKTNVGGGYVFEVIVPGDYTITFESGRQVSIAIDQGDANIKIDSIDRTRVSVNLGRGALRK